MTIRVPKRNILDKLLAIFGKERDIVVPKDIEKTYNKLGPYVIIKTKRESFWKALFRKKEKQGE